MKPTWTLKLALAALAFTVALCGGCGKIAEEGAEKALEMSLSEDGQSVDVDLDAEGGVMRITTEEGEMTISGDDESFSMTGMDGGMTITGGDAAAIPADFPKDVPLPEGFKPTMVQTTKEEGMFMVMGPVEGSMDEATAALRKSAVNQGWTEQHNTNVAGVMAQVTFGKDERVLNLMVLTEDGKTQVSITTMNE